MPRRKGKKKKKNIPCTLIVKEPIRPLLEFLGNRLGLLMTLEPRLVLLMESPALVLERLGGQELLVSALSVIKQVEESICVDPPRIVQSRVVKYRKRFLRVVEGCVVRILRFVVTRLLCVGWFRASRQRCC